MIKKLFTSGFIAAVFLSAVMLFVSCEDALNGGPPETGEEEEEIWTGGPPVKPVQLKAVPGMARVYLTWRKSGGAASYEVWYGTGTDIDAAERFNQTITENSAVVTGLAGGGEYYLWVKALNPAGETVSNRVKCYRTADPIDPAWWTDTDGTGIDWWDSSTDSYEFRFREDGELLMGYCTKGSYTGSGADRGWSIIRYHVSFDPAEMNEKVPRTISRGEGFVGLPGGVFIFERPNAMPSQRYYAAYYWGFMALEPGNRRLPDPSTPPGEGERRFILVKGTPLAYFSNAWALADGPAPEDPYTGNSYATTLEEAIGKYTLGNFNHFIHFVAIPWYPMQNNAYKYGTPEE